MGWYQHREYFRERAAGRYWSPPDTLSLEVEATKLVPIFYERLVELGYRYYKVTQQFLYSPGPCEQGAYASVILGCGSGPFGDAAVDYLHDPEWRSLTELPNDMGFRDEFEL